MGDFGGLVGDLNFKMSGFRAIRKDDALESILEGHAKELADKATAEAGEGKSGPRVYGVRVKKFPDRFRAFVFPDTFNAKYHEAQEGVLRKVTPS